ncbi:Hypothetical Protein FCC1311_014402 [Hondaea fermentalgiana]|uniref:Uncharacterized protein n=1 Tax=Hondaea fermentalgiana TaxID=2315210 RepID=A0A2R5G9N8_9STRA|nr:Hypothetical Protein FCC1311_014402 [Hondaea fermentalgiana]|eukprot:GBG25223.1 Hypothetical Protein FCC1311_014402 [Hondaea fermentalgiana]
MSVALISQPVQAFVGLSNPYTSVMHFVFAVVPPDQADHDADGQIYNGNQKSSSSKSSGSQLGDRKSSVEVLQRGLVRPDRERSKDFTVEVEGVANTGSKGTVPTGFWTERVHMVSLRPSRRFCIDAKSDFSNDFYVKFRFVFVSDLPPHRPVFRATVTSCDINLRSKNKTATSEQYQAFRSGQIMFRDRLVEGVHRARKHFQTHLQAAPGIRLSRAEFLRALSLMPTLPDNAEILERYMSYNGARGSGGTGSIATPSLTGPVLAISGVVGSGPTAGDLIPSPTSAGSLTSSAMSPASLSSQSPRSKQVSVPVGAPVLATSVISQATNHSSPGLEALQQQLQHFRQQHQQQQQLQLQQQKQLLQQQNQKSQQKPVVRKRSRAVQISMEDRAHEKTETPKRARAQPTIVERTPAAPVMSKIEPEPETAMSRIASLEGEVCELQTVVQNLTDRLQHLERTLATNKNV